MDEAQLREFVANRKPGYRPDRVEDLVCYGCAHAAADAPPPGRPSGERPCLTCVRNREEWATRELPDIAAMPVFVDDEGTARCMDPTYGFMYNGAPYPHWPPDNYITMDAHDLDDYMARHPEYAQEIWFDDAGNARVARDITS